MNKNIIGIFSVILLVSLLIFSFASAELTISSNSGDRTVFREEGTTGYFDLTNTGPENITNVNFTQNLPSGISISYIPTTPISTLVVNTTQRVAFVLNASSIADLGDFTGTINIHYSNNTIATSFTFNLEVKKNYCSEGTQGTNKLSFTIDEPDNGDDFYAGENISINVNVENNGYDDEIDFVIEAELFDITTGDSIADDTKEGSLDEDEDDDYDLAFKVPYDVDASDNYVINIKVYEDGNEEEQCKQNTRTIEIKKRTHDLVVEKKTFNSIIACNSPINLNLKIANSGKKDEDNTLVKVSNTALNFSAEQERDINSGDYENFLFNDFVPITSPGKYTFNIRVSSDAVSVSDSVTIELRDNCVVQRKDVLMTLVPQGNAVVEQDSVVKVTLTNTGTVQLTYSISVSDYNSWGSLTSISPTTLQLGAGQSGDVFVTFKPSQNASSINTFKVKATYDSGSKTQDGTLSLSSGQGQTTNAASFLDQLAFEMKRSPWIFIVNIVLIIVVIILIVIAARPRKVVVKENNREPNEARLKRKK